MTKNARKNVQQKHLFILHRNKIDAILIKKEYDSGFTGRPNLGASMNVYQYQTDSPTGRLRLFADSAHLLAILWENDAPNRVVLPAAENVQEHDVLQAAASQLQAYFAGDLNAFTVPLRLQGTAFQQQVWQALQTIPYGQTRTYKDIAASIGRPSASRAVGAAIGRNPVSIIVPCHRVLGVNGNLTGFAGGLDNKRFLLDLEQASPQPI